MRLHVCKKRCWGITPKDNSTNPSEHSKVMPDKMIQVSQSLAEKEYSSMIMIRNKLPRIMRVSKEGKKVETMTRPSVLPDLNQTKDICYTCILHAEDFLP